MKRITLSNHTADQLRSAQQAREAKFQALGNEYNSAVIKIRERKQSAYLALREAWKERRVWGTMWSLGKLIVVQFSVTPAPPVRPPATDKERVWLAGNKGEQSVSLHLQQQLNDSWTVIDGYRGDKGEIDQIAVGPDGMAAIEVKYVNGTVHCNGDYWFRDKYDKYGNLVEQEVPIGIRKGAAQASDRISRRIFCNDF